MFYQQLKSCLIVNFLIHAAMPIFAVLLKNVPNLEGSDTTGDE